MKGFTLLQVLVSMVILVIIMAALYSAYTTNVEAIQIARQNGGTGSMGSTLLKRILTGEEGRPKKVIVFSRDEAKQDEMRKRMTIYGDILEFRLGDVRDYASVRSVVRGMPISLGHSGNIIINAAALKQVPSCEYEPIQALLTNCMGVVNIVRAAEEHLVDTVLTISTDKACKPVNVMGMTKALQERIIGAANLRCPRTRFLSVRYGNVLASRGSVIPLFYEQIRNGGPVTITVPEMTRFLLSLDQAVDTSGCIKTW